MVPARRRAERACRLTDAIDSYRRALAVDPLDASTNFNLGCLLVRTGAIPSARDHLDAASLRTSAGARLSSCSMPKVAPTSRHGLMPDSLTVRFRHCLSYRFRRLRR